MSNGDEDLCPQENISVEWSGLDHKTQTSDSEETAVFETDDDSKIKPEVELKEETDEFVYKADFHGHLQLVSVAHTNSNPCETVDDCRSDVQDHWSGIHQPQSNNEVVQPVSSWKHTEHPEQPNEIYGQTGSISENSTEHTFFIKEEPIENNSQECTYVHSLPEIYDYSSDSTWEPSAENSIQLEEDISINGSLLLTQAEKKRLYRLRIKEENPLMWSTIKKREAARKREQREKRRQVLYEMQKAMELSSRPDSSESINQGLYLEALKDRYPELWSQLTTAIPATDLRNKHLFSEQNTKGRRQVPKPATMYKDVIEAQKKRMYRQKVREERPEMYERQKAREAYARSIQRLMQKKKTAEQNGYSLESLHPDEIENKLAYLQNLQVQNMQYLQSSQTPPHHFVEGATEGSPVPLDHPLPTNHSTSKSDPSQPCDNNHSEDSYNRDDSRIASSDSHISDQDKAKEHSPVSIAEDSFPKHLSAACSTQSDILWYWNDVKSNQYVDGVPAGTSPVPYVQWRKGPQMLTEEERLQKIERERLMLKEKRRKYRMNMSAEKRSEFLELERERLKQYRGKKKPEVITCQTTVLCIDQ